MSTNDGMPDEGTEPQEEVGPEGCDATPARCEFQPGELDGPPEECDFAAREEVFDAMPVEEIPVIRSPQDGLPVPVDKPIVPAPGLTYDSLVCMEDAREYVETFYDELASQWWRVAGEPDSHLGLRMRAYAMGPEDERQPTVYVRWRYAPDGTEREPTVYDPAAVFTLWGRPFVKIAQDSLRPVRPIRPACRHYQRQCFNNDEQPDPNEPGGRVYFRNCTMRRSVGGAFMSLRDQCVFACDYRDPPEPRSVAVHLDSFDEKLATTKPELVPLFGLSDNELVKED